MKKHIGNGLQADAIRRYHQHLVRLGRAGTLEESARLWICLYAGTWRHHHQVKHKHKHRHHKITSESKT